MQILNKYLYLCLVSGSLLTLSFAPFNQFYFALLCPMALLLSWQQASPNQAFWRGFLFGLGLFATGVSWVFVSIHTYGNAGIILSLFITTLLISILALFPALLGMVLVKYFRLSGLKGMLLAFPAGWVVVEWIRSWIFSGFPWLLLGYSQTSTPLAGYAPLFSVFGVSLATALSSAVLLALWQKPRSARFYYLILGLFLLWGIGQGMRYFPWTQASGTKVKVSMVQGNISQSIKWSQAYQNQILQSYLALNKQALGSSLIFWPEAALPIFPEQIPGYLNALSLLAKQHRASILLGIPLDNPITQQYFNGALVVGDGKGMYLKRHLVPFGEYVPLLNILGPILNSLTIPMSSFNPGPEDQALPVMNGIPVAVFICYESAFPEEFRDTLHNAELIATLSDDSWFGHSLGLYQHQEMDQMRAIETGRYLVRATNNGGTSVINPQGKIIASLPAFSASVLSSEFSPMTGSTPWLRYGMWPLLVLLGFMMTCSIRKRKAPVTETSQ